MLKKKKRESNMQIMNLWTREGEKDEEKKDIVTCYS